MKKQFIQIQRYEPRGKLLGTYTQPLVQAHVLLDEIADAEFGVWKIEIVWMTQAEYDALPEFMGY